MSAVKLLGGVLIMTAGILSALGSAAREKKKLDVLESWIELTVYIRGQIDCFLAPLDEILGGADKTLLTRLNGNGKERSLSAYLKSSEPFLDEETRKLLTSLVRELGTSYREEQVKRCDYYLAGLRAIREKRAAELPQKTRLYTTLSLCASTALLILLW